jgi:hypothetical protein
MKRSKSLDKTKRVKAVARDRVGSPKPARVIEDRRLREKPKHKKNVVVEADI